MAEKKAEILFVSAFLTLVMKRVSVI